MTGQHNSIIASCLKYRILNAEFGAWQYVYGTRVCVIVCRKEMQSTLPLFVTRPLLDDGNVYVAISEEVLPSFRPYVVHHELECAARRAAGESQHCCIASSHELWMVPYGQRAEYARMRRGFFTRLSEYRRAFPLPDDVGAADAERAFRSAIAQSCAFWEAQVHV